MPDEEDKQQQTQPDIDSASSGQAPVPPPPEPVEENSDAQPNPVVMPKDTVQEQIPPVRSKVSKKILIRRLLILLAVLLLLAAAAFAAWKFVLNKKDNAQPAQNSSGQPAAEEETLDIGDTELSETYKNDFLRLEFKHPTDWKVTDAENVVLVKSPSFKVKEKSGNETIGYFKIYIKRGANDADGKYLAKGYAIEQSQKITYSSPAAGQRKDTYLTNFGLDTPDNFAYFVVQGNFNLAQGDTLGPKFAQEPDSFLITGGFANDELADGLATKVVAQNYFADNPAYLTAVEIVKTLQLK